jgi:D-aspartate ligase
MEGPAAIILSGQIAGLGAVRSLGARGVPIVLGVQGADEPAAASRYVRELILLPDPVSDPNGFIRVLEDRRFAGAVVLPTSDELLVAVSRHRDRLSSHMRVGAAAWPIVQTFIEKRLTAELAARAGVAAPATRTVASEADMDRIAQESVYPVLVKPSLSHRYVAAFNRKLTEVHTPAELREACREAMQRGLEVVIQELIPGPDDAGANYNCYVVDGQPVLEFTAAKLRLVPRRYGRPVALVSRQIPEIVGPGRAVVAAAGLEGYACVEFKRDSRDDVYKLMEVNPRINHSISLSTAAGLDVPWLIYRHLAFDERPTKSSFRAGVTWIDGTKDLAISMPEMLRGSISPRAFLQPYARRPTFAVLDIRDPLPALRRYSGGLSRRLRRKAGAVEKESGPG